MVYQTDQGEIDGLAGRCFDDSGFAYSRSIQIDVGALLSSLGFDV
jgi:hypothetical protein